MMKYKQTDKWGCGMYAIAHACNMDSFVTPERLAASKDHGNNIGQLSNWLHEDGHNLYMDILYYNHFGKKLPRSCFKVLPEGDVIALPVVFSVRYSDKSLNHMVGGKIYKDGVLRIYDSLKDEPVNTTLSKINNLYHNVYGFYLFVNPDDGNYAFIAPADE